METTVPPSEAVAAAATASDGGTVVSMGELLV